MIDGKTRDTQQMTRPYLALTLAALAATALAGCNRNPTRTAAATTTAPAGAPASGVGTASNWPTATTTTTSSTVTTTGPVPTTAPVPTAQPVTNVSDPCPSIGTLAETHGGRIALNTGRVIRLNSACGAADMTNHLRTFGVGMRYLLVADDLRAGVQPGTLFRLSLGPPTTGEAAVIGTLSFFGAQRPDAGGMPHSMSFDVTKEVQALALAGWPANGLGVAISPSAEVAPGSDASIGAIRLVAQGR